MDHASWCLPCELSPTSLCSCCNTLQGLSTNNRSTKTPKFIRNMQEFKICPWYVVEQGGVITSSCLPVKHLTNTVLSAGTSVTVNTQSTQVV